MNNQYMYSKTKSQQFAIMNVEYIHSQLPTNKIYTMLH